MVNQPRQSQKRGFEGKAHTLSGPLLGAMKPRQMAFKRAEGQRVPGAAPTPIAGERFAGPGGYLGEPAPQPAAQTPTQTPAQPARQPLGAPHHKKRYVVVLKAVRPNGQEVPVINLPIEIPADAKITALDVYEGTR